MKKALLLIAVLALVAAPSVGFACDSDKKTETTVASAGSAPCGASEKAGSDTHQQVQSAGRLIVTLAPAMFNFTRWSFHADPETAKRFTIQVDDARDLPEVLRYSSAGFCHVVSETACKAKLSIRHERVGLDRILITQEFAEPES